MMLEELQRRNYSAITTRNYLRVVSDFAKHFGKSPDKLGPNELRTYQAYLLTECKLTPGTVVNRVAALRFFFVKTLKRHQFREFLPYPRDRRPLPTVLSREEVARLIDAAGTLFRRTLLMTLYATGMRRSELAHLKVSDIDSQRMIIRVVEGKGGKDRDLPLSPILLETLREYWRWRKPRLYLFPTRNLSGRLNQPISDKTVWIACSDAARCAGIRKRVTPHTLRHYLPFLTMSSDMEWSGDRSIITGPNANPVDQSPDIVFSVFSALQTIKEAKQLVSRLVAPRSAVRR
jgi:integrase